MERPVQRQKCTNNVKFNLKNTPAICIFALNRWGHCSEKWGRKVVDERNQLQFAILSKKSTNFRFRIDIDSIRHFSLGLSEARLDWQCCATWELKISAHKRRKFNLSAQRAVTFDEYFCETRAVCLMEFSCLLLGPDVVLQNIAKLAGKKSLIPHIRDSESVAGLIRSVCALPLLKTEDIPKGLNAIGRRSVLEGQFDLLAPFFGKVADIWLQPEVLEVLSVCGAADRTSNVCESDNSTLDRTVRTAHPSMWRFLGRLICLPRSHKYIAVLSSYSDFKTIFIPGVSPKYRTVEWVA